MTPDELNSRNFISVRVAADVLGGVDERSIRRAIARGEIPAIQVGQRRMVPTAWLRSQIDQSAPASSHRQSDIDQLADLVAEKVTARILTALGSIAANSESRMTRKGELNGRQDRSEVS